MGVTKDRKVGKEERGQEGERLKKGKCKEGKEERRGWITQ